MSILCFIMISCSNSKSDEEHDPVKDGFAVCECYSDAMEANDKQKEEECMELYKTTKRRYDDNQEDMEKLSEACGIFRNF